jgi:phenylacetaldehyde dehydrogenase
VRQFAARGLGAYIGGRAVEGDGAERAIRDPATEEVIGIVRDCSPALVDRAVRSARRAFDDGYWTDMAPAVRERILFRFAELVEQHGEFLAQVETLNQGKSIRLSRAVDVGYSVEFMRFVAGLPTKLTGDTLSLSRNLPGASHTAFTRHEPIGVVAAIAPWNFPMAIALWKIFPALAAGCTVVLKPSEITPLSALRLAELATEAGLPDGCLNIVVGDGRVTGSALVAHDDISKIAFTGSTAAGKEIARNAVDGLKRVSLELGGKNPAIFCEDVDVAGILPGALAAAFLNQGQVCAAASRIYAHRAICDGLIAGMNDAIRTMTIGSGMDPDSQINPLVSAGHRDKVIAYLEEARASGSAVVLDGGQTQPRGFFVAPHIVVDPGERSRIQREEVFGPVVTITPFDDYGEALRLANDTQMGLTASIWTNDLQRTMAMSRKLQAGTVWVNNHSMLDAAMPFGGFKQSGHGRDFGKDALLAFTESKSVCITTPAEIQ